MLPSARPYSVARPRSHEPHPPTQRSRAPNHHHQQHHRISKMSTPNVAEPGPSTSRPLPPRPGCRTRECLVVDSWAEASSSTRTRYDHTTRKNRTTTSISTSPPRVRGSRSRSPRVRRRSGDAIFASFSTKLTCLCFPRHPPRPPGGGERVHLPPSKSREIATSTLLPCRRSIARARARSRASARVPDASSSLVFAFAALVADRRSIRFSLP